jgi:hypothetical protein
MEEWTTMANTIDLGSVEEAKQFASGQNGAFLVLSRETLDQIEAAEAAGGFEGGMSGSSGEGGFSASGTAPNSSSGSDPVPVELLDMDGAVPVGAFFEGLVEKILEIREVWHQYHGNPTGPIILVPKRELDRWLGIASPDDA